MSVVHRARGCSNSGIQFSTSVESYFLTISPCSFARKRNGSEIPLWSFSPDSTLQTGSVEAVTYQNVNRAVFFTLLHRLFLVAEQEQARQGCAFWGPNCKSYQLNTQKKKKINYKSNKTIMTQYRK